MSKPTADWEKLGDSFYRKVQLYTSVFDENVDLREYQISAAPCSGAIGTFACARMSQSLIRNSVVS